MALTSPEKIHEVLKQAYDPARVESLYRKACYSFGGSWDRYSGSTTRVGNLVECPDIVVDYLAIGQSRRILNTSLISLAGTMYAQPSPEFQGIDKHTAEVRRQYLLRRGEGTDDGDPEWADEDEMAYLDGDGLGFGGSQVCLKTNPQTGKQLVTIEHVPAFHVIHDRVSRGFGRARMVAFVKYLSPDDFGERFGEDKRREYETYLYDESLGSGWGEAIRVCRVVEYYDLGIGDTDPTRAILAGDLSGEILEDGPNSFECLPFAHYSHWHPTGSRYPIGRIDTQMGTHEALNEVERAIRRQTKKQGFAFVDEDKINEDDLEAVIDGEADYARFKNVGQPGAPYFPAPGQEITNTLIQWQGALERQFSTDSGQTDLDRGVADRSNTLGQTQLLVGRSQSQGSRSALQAIKYHRRKYDLVQKVAAKFDRDPLQIDVYGQSYTINAEGNTASSCQNWFRDPARVLISEDAMRYQDQQLQQAQKSQTLMSLGDLVQTGLVSAQWWAEERIRAAGYDPKDAAGGQAAQAAQAGQMGDPNGQQTPGGPPQAPGIAGPAVMQPQPNGAAGLGLPGLAQ